MKLKLEKKGPGDASARAGNHDHDDDVNAKGVNRENRRARRRRKALIKRGCPTLLNAQTAGELLDTLKRRNPRTRATLEECYFALCAMPCAARPCCRPDNDVTLLWWLR